MNKKSIWQIHYIGEGRGVHIEYFDGSQLYLASRSLFNNKLGLKTGYKKLAKDANLKVTRKTLYKDMVIVRFAKIQNKVLH